MKNLFFKRIIWLIAFFVFAIDFLVKNYLFNNFFSTSTPIVKNIFHISVVCNSGTAFGFLQNRNQFLIYINFIFILIFLFLIRGHEKRLLVLVGSGLILGGALSNLSDRIFFGCVVDYIDFRIWPVFNISDMCINLGIGLLLLDLARGKKLRP